MTKAQLNASLRQIHKDYLDDRYKHHQYQNLETYLLARLIVATEAVRDNTESIREDMPPVYSD